MAGDYTLQGLAIPETVDQLQDLMVRVRAEHPDIDETDLAMFETAVVEIHGNVIEHSQPHGQVTYVFRLDVHEDRLVGHLADTGQATPDLSGVSLPDPLAESGRGLHLARVTLDELDYDRTGDRNTWRMVRFRR